MEIIQISIRTILSYFILVISLRIMGKREIGQLNLFDLIILLSIADIMIIGIENYKDNWLLSLVPVILLTLIQKIVAFILMKSNKIRKLIDGSPSIIIKKGKICVKEMSKQSYNIEDLILQLREKEIYNIEDVSLAILETNGNLSVYQGPIENFCPIPIIISGEINQKALEITDKTRTWIMDYLGKNHLDIKKIICGYLVNNQICVVKSLDE